MNKQDIENRAREIQAQAGGSIFAFPIDEDDPFSKYAIVTLFGEQCVIFPDPLDVEEAAAGVASVMEGAEEAGIKLNYERDVRFTVFEAQKNAPTVTMRRLRKHESFSPPLQTGTDVIKRDDDEGYLFSARGILKFSYLEMVDNKLPKAIQFMDRYYELLASRRYGKTPAAIKREVRRMGKDEAVRWIEQTYSKYIHEDMAILNIMESLKG